MEVAVKPVRRRTALKLIGGAIAMSGIPLLAACSQGTPSSSSATAPAPPTTVANAPGPAPSLAASPAASPAAALTPAASANLRNVSIGFPAPSTSFFPLQVADRQGYFAAQGLSLTFGQMTPSDLVAGLLSNSLDLSVEITGAIQAIVQAQAPLRAVGAVAVKPQHAFMVQPSINTFADLRGKTVGVNQLLDFTHWEVITILQANGIDPQDVNVIAIPASPSRVAGLQSGQLQGTILGIPFDLQARNSGFHELGQLSRDLDIVWVGLACSQSFLAQQRSVVVGTLTGILQGLQFVRANRDASIPILADWLQLAPDVATQAFDEALPTYSMDGLAIDQAWQNTLQVAALAGSVPATVAIDSFVDTSPLKEAQQRVGG